jgi:serine/threonine protein phosphatase PrpC
MVGWQPPVASPQAPADGGGLPDGWIRAEVAAFSACGPVRDQNEDRVGWIVLGALGSVRSPGTDEPVSAVLEGPGIAIAVADGLGGHAHGELASRTAMGRLLRHLSSPDAIAKPGEHLRTGFEEANQACLAGELVDADAFDRDPVGAEPRSARERRADDATDSPGATMGPGAANGQTTLTAIALTGRTGNLAHVGDSRLYRLRGGDMELLTNDHTQARELVRMRVIKPEQVLTHPGRHLLTRSIGGDLVVRVDERASAPAVGDTYLLCSDGLWSSITSWETLNALSGDLATGVVELVSRVEASGGDDNASVIALRVAALSGAAEPTSTGWRLPWRK